MVSCDMLARNIIWKQYKMVIRTHFLNGVVTGSEWLKFGFITNGFSRICGPSDAFVVGGLSGRLGGTGDETVDGTGGLIDGE